MRSGKQIIDGIYKLCYNIRIVCGANGKVAFLPSKANACPSPQWRRAFCLRGAGAPCFANKKPHAGGNGQARFGSGLLK